MRVAVNGWFSGSSVGSGQYVDELVPALRAEAMADEFAVIAPGARRGGLGKLTFEQIVFPRMSTGYDLAHVPYWAPPMLPAVATVVTVHDLIPLVLAEYRQSAGMRAYFSLVARATARSAAVVVDSLSTKADVLARLDLPADKVHVAYLGVGPAFCPTAGQDPHGAAAVGPAKEPAAELAARLGLPSRYGLYVGGFDVRKNLVTLMAAWRKVHAATGTVLVLAGSPPANSRVGREPIGVTAERAGLPGEAFMAVGHVPRHDLPDLYRGAAVFAYPSRYEGFGLPPLEAMACGAPVVASNATSLPEVVGDAGLLLPCDDVEAWSRALIEVLTVEATGARLRAAGPPRAALFSWARTARRTLEVYRSVARAGASP